jgi:RND family efflux transporter MFP subunit
MIKRYFITLFLVVAAISVIYTHQRVNVNSPWTRDGQVSAEIISIAPRVTGPVTKIHVSDNSHVKAGDLLFEIDPSLYVTTHNKMQASLNQAKALLDKAKNEATRAFNLEQRTSGALAELTLNNLRNAVDTAQANVDLAQASLDEATLNVEFTKVYAPTDGFVTNLNLRRGSQVVANSPVFALIDEHSFWIEGYFKETDLVNVAPNDIALVTLLSQQGIVLEGEVESIGYGIAKQDGSTGNNLLPNVNPTFQWIRLAQRIPIKVKLNSKPADLQLRVGMSASIKIIKQPT